MIWCLCTFVRSSFCLFSGDRKKVKGGVKRKRIETMKGRVKEIDKEEKKQEEKKEKRRESVREKKRREEKRKEKKTKEKKRKKRKGR